MRPLVSVVTAAEAAAWDRATVNTGVPSRALMQRAGAATAAIITDRYPEQLTRGVLVIAGPGNNGGDGWVIARCLASAGVSVAVISPEGAKTPDCAAERTLGEPFVDVRTDPESGYRGEGVVIDAGFGIGARGKLEGPTARALRLGTLARRAGAIVVAVDVPSGITDEATEHLADLTVSYGNVKRSLLTHRHLCGRIVAVDIGLAPFDAAAYLVDGEWVRRLLPAFEVSAHKGTRGKLLIEGGGPGMTGAAILAARAALRSGVGMLKLRLHPEHTAAMNAAIPEALTELWTDPRSAWADASVIGPGLGRRGGTRDQVIEAIRQNPGPIVIDADALNAFEGERSQFAKALGGRPAVITPHVVEAARLAGISPEAVESERFEFGAGLARELHAVVVLKGVPTVIDAPDGRCFVVATGTPTLATAGSGDILSGIAGVLAMQIDDSAMAAACAAWIHGRAAEFAGAFVRGTTLDDVLEMIPNAIRIPESVPRYPIIAELPAVPRR